MRPTAEMPGRGLLRQPPGRYPCLAEDGAMRVAQAR